LWTKAWHHAIEKSMTTDVNSELYAIDFFECLNGERISVRIMFFGLIAKNSVRLVISQKI
jgi:hypothetical protein